MSYDFKKEFIYSLSTLERSKEKFFITKIPNSMDLKIIIDQSGCDWINDYKYCIHNAAKIVQSKTNSSVSDEKFRFIYYFFEFVLPDIIIISKLLPKKASRALDIGSGIGLFDVFLDQFYKSNIEINIIEVAKLNEIEHHKINKIKKIKKPIYVLDQVKSFLKKNNIKKFNAIESKSVNNFSNYKYDMIFSFRSWGFLYDLDIYLDYVKKTLSKKGFIIADIKREKNILTKFNKSFKNVKILYAYQAHLRLIGELQDS